MAKTSSEMSGPVYVEIARHAVKGPFSASTRTAQVHCLLACSVFLLAWFNLVAVGEVEFAGAKLTISLRVIGTLAIVYALYQLIRFLSEALLELRLYELELEPIKTAAAAEVDREREGVDRRASAFRAALDAFGTKVNENRAAYEAREARIAEIEAAHRPTIANLKAKAEAFGPLLTSSPVTPEEAALVRERADAYESWYDADNELRRLLAPLREERLPHHDMDEGNGLVSRSLHVYDMPSTELIIKAMNASRQRGRLVALLDIALPASLSLVSLGVFAVLR